MPTDQAPPHPTFAVPFATSWQLPNGFGSGDCETDWASIPPEMARERVGFSVLNEGVALVNYSGRMKTEVTVTGTVISPRPYLVLRAPTAGRTDIRMNGTALDESTERYSLYLHCREGESYTVTQPVGTLNRVVAPIVYQEQLQSLLAGHRLPPPLERFLDGHGDSFLANPQLSLAMRRVVAEIQANPYHGAIANLYLHGKVYEMLAQVVADLTDDGLTTGRFPSAELRRGAQARDLLLADPLAPPSLGDLAMRVGLSQRRLTEVFRALYGQTVCEWLMARRMDHAGALLREGTLPIKQIAFRLGYGHVNNFIGAFTRHFGVPPATYRKSLVSTHAVGRISS